ICFYRLGILYAEGGEPQRGAHYLRKASELGFGLATVNLAAMMLQGLGTERKVAEGVALLEKELQSDNKNSRSEALAKLGGAYLRGIGVEKNLPKAMSLLGQAVDLGNGEAMVALGNLYDLGEEIPRDETKALALLERAVALEHPSAKAALGR